MSVRQKIKKIKKNNKKKFLADYKRELNSALLAVRRSIALIKDFFSYVGKIPDDRRF